MTLRTLPAVAVATTLLLSSLVVTAAMRTGTAPAGAAGRTFQHVVIIVQENRTPDNLFQGLCAPPFGTATSCSTTDATKYDIQTKDWRDNASAGGRIAPKRVKLADTYDLNHSHGAQGFLGQCDLLPHTRQCRMDGAASCSGTCMTDPSFRYVDYSTGDVNPYLELATQYGWANAMFQTNQGPSYPAHQFLFGGTSAPSAPDDAAGIFASENLVGTGGVGGFNKTAGCAAPENTRVELIRPGGEGTKKTRQFIFPCFEHQTLPDLLKGSLTWRYYAPAPGTIWTAPNSIAHICHATAQGGTCAGPEWSEHLDFSPPDVLDDIAACKLRSVSWVIPAAKYSDHAGLHSGAGGPAWVASIVNAIGKSTACDGGNGYWNDTAIFITWDDWGGWYDHVAPTFLPPPQGDYQYGFRVPLIVVSAYTRKGLINGVHHDFGSILRFTEQNFGIKEGTLNFADSRSASDLRGFFDPTGSPRPFAAIKAPAMTASVMHDTSPPDDD